LSRQLFQNKQTQNKDFQEDAKKLFLSSNSLRFTIQL
jgi:hypothetical protein